MGAFSYDWEGEEATKVICVVRHRGKSFPQPGVGQPDGFTGGSLLLSKPRVKNGLWDFFSSIPFLNKSVINISHKAFAWLLLAECRLNTLFLWGFSCLQFIKVTAGALCTLLPAHAKLWSYRTYPMDTDASLLMIRYYPIISKLAKLGRCATKKSFGSKKLGPSKLLP